MESNKEVYASKKIVQHYERYSPSLQKPEETILSILKPHLGGMRMLDIGVGGGRTTVYFGPLVKSYTAIDFSAGMIELCRKKFGTAPYSPRFEVCDVRDLSLFADASFDLVLFSFNGLDNITYEDRVKAMREMKRVCAPGAWFCLSSHNLLSLPYFFKLKFRWHPVKFLRSVLLRRKLLRRNADAIRNFPTADHVIIYDDVYDFGLYTNYMRPSFQVEELQKAGFKDVKVFGSDGKETSDPSLTDFWLYYLCHL